MSENKEIVDLVKIIQALELIGCEVIEAKRQEYDENGGYLKQARICISVKPCLKKTD